MFYFGLVLAGGSGVLLRFCMNKVVAAMQWTTLPFGTLLANVLGSFLIGYLSWLFVHRWQLSAELQAIVLTGFLGGFTTFSAFSLEVVTMFENGLNAKALLYIVLSVLLSVLMCLLGLILAKQT